MQILEQPPVGAGPARRAPASREHPPATSAARATAQHDEVREGLTAATFQHGLDHSTARCSSAGQRSSTAHPRPVQAQHDATESARRLVERVGRDSYWCTLAGRGCAGGRCGDRRRGWPDCSSLARRAGAAEERAALYGLTPPGLANAHSHAFQRALRGRTHGSGSFWTWREQMYGVAGLNPENYLGLARGTYAEMALAGITTVGEFHYVHHGLGGMPYDNLNETWAER